MLVLLYVLSHRDFLTLFLLPSSAIRLNLDARLTPGVHARQQGLLQTLALVESFARGELAADWTNILSNPRADFRFY